MTFLPKMSSLVENCDRSADVCLPVCPPVLMLVAGCDCTFDLALKVDLTITPSCSSGMMNIHYSLLCYADDRSTRNLYKKLARVNLREKLVRVSCRLAARFFSCKFLASNRTCSILCKKLAISRADLIHALWLDVTVCLCYCFRLVIMRCRFR